MSVREKFMEFDNWLDSVNYNSIYEITSHHNDNPDRDQILYDLQESHLWMCNVRKYKDLLCGDVRVDMTDIKTVIRKVVENGQSSYLRGVHRENMQECIDNFIDDIDSGECVIDLANGTDKGGYIEFNQSIQNNHFGPSLVGATIFNYVTYALGEEIDKDNSSSASQFLPPDCLRTFTDEEIETIRVRLEKEDKKETMKSFLESIDHSIGSFKEYPYLREHIEKLKLIRNELG